MTTLTPQAEALNAVFAQAAALLAAHPFALEMLEEEFRPDAQADQLDLSRLRGYLQGLAGSGALPYEDYCEMEACLIHAFDL